MATPQRARSAARPPRRERVGDRPAPEHDVGAACFKLAADKILDGPHFAVGDDRNVDRRPHFVDRRQARRWTITVERGPAVHDQFVDATAGQRLRAVDGEAGVIDAETHLCRKRDVDRNHHAHGADDLVEQFRLAEQRGAAAMAVDWRRRAAEVEIDAGRIQRHQPAGVLGHEMRVGAGQLHAHRRPGGW
mgnify:CR=1 FL=1